MNTLPAPKPKFPRADALSVAKEICDALKPYTLRIIVAGSLRRRKDRVGDVEILYIPISLTPEKSADFFKPAEPINLANTEIVRLCCSGILEPRTNIKGSHTWGEQNKLARHCKTGIPVDLFSTTQSAWFNYLVCRTGSAENNTRIAAAAQAKGWKWHPYSKGFTDSEGNPVTVQSEQDVFRLAGLPYLEPWER